MMAGITQYMVDIFFNVSTISPELVFWLMLAMVPAIGRLSRNEEPASAELEEVTQTEISAPPYVTRTRFMVSLGCAIILIIIGIGITVRPFLADMYFQKGLELQLQGDEHAIYAFDTATSLGPEEAFYWHFLGLYSDAVARRVTKEADKTNILSLANKAFDRALELMPYSAFEHYSQADIYTYWANEGAVDKWPLALSLYDKATQLLPRNAILLNMWSLALIIKGDFSQAQTKLDYAASIAPDLAETSFLSGLLLAKEGKDGEAVLKLIAPIQDDPANLNSFIDLCLRLYVYDMIKPLGDSLEIYTQETPDDWIAHALLGITGMFGDNLDNTLGEFNTAMSLVPGNDAGDLFRAFLRLSSMSEPLKIALPSVAADWKAKLIQSPERDTLLIELDKLVNTPP
jgi:tetratricopeptide (TPR) repeat protein